MGLLDGLSEADKGLILHGKQQRSAPAGTVLYRAGDPADHVFYVVSGTVEVVAQASTGEVALRKTLGTGQVFGEAALFPGGATRVAAATVTADVVLFEFAGNAVDTLRRHSRSAAACTFLMNFVSTLSAQFLEYRRALPLGAKLQLQRHPDYPIEPELLLRRIAEAVPTGFFSRLFSKTKFPKGEVLTKEGDVLDRFYILRDGSIKASSSQWGDVVLHAPDIVGQTYLFANQPSEYTATAIIDCQLLPFTLTALQDFVRTNPEEGIELLNALALLTALRLVVCDYQR